jgi:hypothetical protein
VIREYERGQDSAARLEACPLRLFGGEAFLGLGLHHFVLWARAIPGAQNRDLGPLQLGIHSSPRCPKARHLGHPLLVRSQAVRDLLLLRGGRHAVPPLNQKAIQGWGTGRRCPILENAPVAGVRRMWEFRPFRRRANACATDGRGLPLTHSRSG